MITPRPYQERCISELRAKVREGIRSLLVIAPTGAGKTVIAVLIILGHLQSRVDNPSVLFLAHRAELIEQCARKLRSLGLKVRTIQATRVIGPPDANVIVASIQTLSTKRWAERLPPATLVVFDECHHVRANSWEKLADYYSKSILIGLTATPERADGKGLGDIFADFVEVSTVSELTELGNLVPCSVFAPNEFKDALAADPCDVYLEHGESRKAIIFNANVVAAKDCAERLRAAGVRAECVDGSMAVRDRRAVLDRFKTGETMVLTNVAVLTEGFDEPSAEVCILARACDHAGLYRQIIGRVLRPAPGKTSATLIDLRGAVHRHGLPDDDLTYSLTGKAITRDESLPPLKQCRGCGYCGRLFKACPQCGAVTPDPVAPEVVRAHIEQIVRQETDDQRHAYYKKLCAQAAASGYARGWVAHRYRAKYGVWPVGMVA